MIIIIDAYNILKQITKTSFINERERSEFIARLAEYARLRSHALVIVFDNGPYERPAITKKDEVSIIYSGRHESADEYIKNYAQKNLAHDRHTMLIVSSDRGLYSFASHNGIYSIGALEFYRLVNERLAKKPLIVIKSQERAQKLNQQESNQELDALMQEASKIIINKDVRQQEYAQEKDKHTERLPKREKKMLKIVKKL